MVDEVHGIHAARAYEAQLLSDLALRSKAHWGYSPEFIEACRYELSYSEKQLLSEDERFFVLEDAEEVRGRCDRKQVDKCWCGHTTSREYEC